MSSSGVNPNPSVVASNENLRNGQTYTTTFYGNNWFSNPSPAVIAADIEAQAPDFLQNVQVVTPSLANSQGSGSFLSTPYNVTFTYEGDGSDVLTDVLAAIVAAVLATSNDNISAGVTYQGNGLTPVQTVSNAVTTDTGAVLSTASTIAQQVADAALNPAANAVNKALIGLFPLLAVVIAIVLFVLPSLSKTTRESGLV